MMSYFLITLVRDIVSVLLTKTISNKMEMHSKLNHIYTRSFFSSQELKIDEKDNNLKISTFSLSNISSSYFPLELINAKPEITKTPNLHAATVGLIGFTSSMFLYALASNSSYFNTQIIATLLLALSVISFIISWKKHNTHYSFFCKNTSISIFKLHCVNQENPEVEGFVKTLSDKILQVTERNHKLSFISDMESHLLSNLDSLYNHGLVNGALYENIATRIEHKIHGTKPNQELAEVINLPIRKA